MTFFAIARMRAHATLAAFVLWFVAGVLTYSGEGYRSVLGPLKGSDFIQFYTLGHIDRQTASTALYDPEGFYRLQTELVPESAAERYLGVYPPHAAILFRPLAGLTYGGAALTWAALLCIAYAGCIWLAWRPFRTVLYDKRLLIAAAAAFPPFWYLVLHGQTTIVPLAAFCLGWLALERRRPFLAGMALGLLLLKPQFALVLAALVLICGEWSMLAGAAVSVGAQVATTIALLGTSVWRDYALLVMRLPELNPLLEPRPEQMHSISAMTNRLPADWSMIVWASLSALVILRTIQVWRSSAPVAMRTAVLIVGSVLVNPHVFSYDATVLAPALIWLGGWAYGESHTRRTLSVVFAPSVYALSVCLILPTATFVPVQVSVVILVGLFVVVTRDLLTSHTLSIPEPLVPMSSRS